MSYYALIKDGEIVGNADTADNLPDGFEAIEVSPETDLANAYVDKGKIKPRPDRPSPDHVWFGHEWKLVEAEPITELEFEDWGGLLHSLRGSDIWAKVFAASSASLKVQSAWTLIYGTLTATRNVQDLAFAIAAFRAASPKTLTKTDLESLQQLLTDHGITDAGLIDALSTTEAAGAGGGETD